jgi:agmatinase
MKPVRDRHARFHPRYLALGGGAWRPAFTVVAFMLHVRAEPEEDMARPEEHASALTVARGAGIATFMGLPHTRELSGVDAAIVGVPSDTGGTPGSRGAPRAMRDVSSLLRPVHAHHNVAPMQTLRAIDYGDLPVVPGSLQRTYGEIVAGLRPLFDNGVIPVCLGGDHSITLAHLRAAAEKHGPVAMLQFDSHTDVYDVYYETERYNAGTPFRRAAEEGVVDTAKSIMVGLRGTVYTTHDYQDARDLGYGVRTMDDVAAEGLAATVAAIRDRVGDHPLFLTFDVDCLDPAFAPGTGTLEIGGLTTREALTIVRGLAGLNFVGFDVVEVNPLLDPGRTTAVVGATMAFEFLALLALARLGDAPRGSN